MRFIPVLVFMFVLAVKGQVDPLAAVSQTSTPPAVSSPIDSVTAAAAPSTAGSNNYQDNGSETGCFSGDCSHYGNYGSNFGSNYGNNYGSNYGNYGNNYGNNYGQAPWGQPFGQNFYGAPGFLGGSPFNNNPFGQNYYNQGGFLGSSPFGNNNMNLLFNKIDNLEQNIVLTSAFFNTTKNLTYSVSTNNNNNVFRLDLSTEFIFGKSVDCTKAPEFTLAPGLWRLTLGSSLFFSNYGSTDLAKVQWFTLDKYGNAKTPLGVAGFIAPTTYSVYNLGTNPVSEALVFVRPGTYLRIAPYLTYINNGIRNTVTTDLSKPTPSANIAVDTRGTYGIVQQLVSFNTNYNNNKTPFGTPVNGAPAFGYGNNL